MRNRTLSITFAAAAIFAQFIFIVSCGNPAPPSNEAKDAKLLPPPPLPKACKDNDSNQQKINDLYADLARLPGFDTSLGDQLNGRPTPHPDPSPDAGVKNFSIRFEEYESSTTGEKRIVMRLIGKIVGDENPADPQNKATKVTKLLKFLDRNMTRGCIDSVSFEAGVTGVRAEEMGFEWWGACEHPNTVCSDGSCRRDCTAPLATPRVTPTPTPSGSATPTPSPSPSPSPSAGP